MNITSHLHSKPGSFFFRLLSIGLAVGLLGAPFSPTLAATTPSPVVDQSPLIIQKPLPPNITLMLDDSGSMTFGYMPDICYIPGTTGCNSSRRATSSTVPNNDALINSSSNGVYYDPTITYVPPVKADGTSYPNATGLTAAWVDGFNASQSNLKDLTKYTGSSSDNGQNIPLYYSYTNAAANRFFWYTTLSSGVYVRHYVANTSCGTQLINCVLAADTSGTSAPKNVAAGQNIANWFAYYHTRILMTKSGLMDAFSSIDATFRVGFGSINGTNKNGLPSSTSTFNSKTIANDVVFGDGSSGTQKSKFWSWLVGVNPGGGTPLQLSLDAVGQYYQSTQPWQTSSSDDTELACRQSYTILTTDGFWNGSSPGNPNIDGTNGTKVLGANGQSFTYTAALPYKDNVSDTLADVAMKYWETDLRPNSTNEVPVGSEDPAFWQHMTTFTLGLGFAPLYADQSTPIPMADVFKWANGGPAIANFSWPTPTADSINNIADLAHAAVDGHGGFYSATSPEAFRAGLKDALKRAAERVGTGASLAANSTQLKTGAFAYQANYYTAKWKGDLKAIAVDPNNGTLATTTTWSAADPTVLPSFGTRNINTYNPSVSPVVAVAFSDPTKLSITEQAALGSSTANQQNMINYLRGDASMEKPKTGGIFRTRDTPLGDIVDSQPVYVGQPDANQFIGAVFTGSDTFASYAATIRQGLIFVAANDGMLHAFDAGTAAVPAGTGAEVYAYLPAAVITTNTSTAGRTTGDLTTISDPDYGLTAAVPHQYFNDGELTVADAYFGSAWHSVAVGTTGRGLAKAVYALDVTDPTNIKLLWERSAGDGNTNADYIGQMTGKPVIAQTNDAGTLDSTGNSNWSVLIGNGYNSKNGVAALLQFKLSDGTLNVHPTDSTTGNGLAAPAVWMDDPSVGISTTAYAGDAKGRVWSFVLNQITGNGKNAVPTSTPTSIGLKLFTATDGTTVQPITAGMLAGKNPLTGDLWVFFGTGQYLGSGDLSTRDTQSWYGLIVQSSATSGSTAVSATTTRTALRQRSIIAETPGTAAVVADPNATPPVLASPAIAPARAVTALPVPSDMGGKSGWYMDLLSPTSTTASDGTVTYTPDQIANGERIVTPGQFQGNQLLATTRIPSATDLCNPSGRGWIMAVDPFTGTSPKSSFFDLNGDGQINQPGDYIMVNGKAVATSGIGFSSLPNNPIFMGGSMLVSFDNGSATSIKTAGTSNTPQRVSWRELINQ